MKITGLTLLFLFMAGIVPAKTVLEPTLEERMELYVDPAKGSDSNPGNMRAPFRTIERARDEIRQNRSSMPGDITVWLRGGEYNYADRCTVRHVGSGEKAYTVRTSVLTFDERDSGKEGHLTLYKAYPGERPVISGGKRITGWQLHDAKLNIYKTNIGKGIDTRQLYVNGQRAIVARSEGVPANLTFDTAYGHTTTDTFMAGWKNVQDIEFVYFDQWVEYRIKVDNITANNSMATITINPPVWQFSIVGRFARIRNAASLGYVENAYELLDSDGEWYLNHSTGDLFYKPRSGENMTTAEAIIPVVDELLTAKGSSRDNRFENVVFEGITFEYAGWLRPNMVRFQISNQNNTLRDDNNRLPEAAVTIKTAREITFERCRFTRLGSTGLFMHEGIRDVKVIGNKFVDLSGGGMNIEDGALFPKDMENVTITDNYIRKIGVEYLPSAGISIAQGKNIYIGHNEIGDFPYIGIHMAWHSNGTVTEHVTVENNYIHDYLTARIFDGGGIYALGTNPLGNAENPAYTVQGNYICNQLTHKAPLYADNYSTWWLARNNVIDLKSSPLIWDKNIPPQFFHTNWGQNLRIVNNYVTTKVFTETDGKNNTYQWNLYPDAIWPREAIGIIANAGLEEPYRDLWDADARFNLVLNPGFETRQENVWITENAQWSRVTSENLKDNTSAKIIPAQLGGHIHQTIHMWKGMHYRASVWVKPGSQKNIGASLYAKTGEGEKSKLLKLAGATARAGEWSLLEGEIDYSGDELSVPVKLFVQTDSPAGTPYYLDEFLLIENSVISKGMLRKAVASAKKLCDGAVEGTGTGEYARGSKAEFLAGIEDAKTVVAAKAGNQHLYFGLKALYAHQLWFQKKK